MKNVEYILKTLNIILRYVTIWKYVVSVGLYTKRWFRIVSKIDLDPKERHVKSANNTKHVVLLFKFHTFVQVVKFFNEV